MCLSCVPPLPESPRGLEVGIEQETGIGSVMSHCGDESLSVVFIGWSGRSVPPFTAPVSSLV